MSRVIIKTRRCPVCGYEYQVKEFYTSKAEQNGGKIDDSWWLPDGNYYTEFLEKKEIIKGTEFKMVEYSSKIYNSKGDWYSKTKYLGMFCPRCGVFMDIDTCTESKEVEE